MQKQRLNTRYSAVVLAFGINALGVVRSLGEKNIRIIVIAPDKCLAAQSRYVSRSYIHNGSFAKDDLKLLSILQTISSSGNALIPTSDHSAEFIAHNREVLIQLGYKFLAPSSQVISMFVDKKIELEAIKDMGLEIPPTLVEFPKNSSNILETMELPVIIKPKNQSCFKITQSKNVIISNKVQLDSFIYKYEKQLRSFIIQKIIPYDMAENWGCSCVFDRNGEMLEAFTYKKLWTNPPHFGVATVGISLDNPQIKRLVAKIGNITGYVGPADFDFIFDKRTQKYMYIETNPRIGMHNWFDKCCGIETAYNAYCLSVNSSSIKRSIQSNGIYYIDIWSDFYSKIVGDESLKNIIKFYMSLVKQKKIGAVYSWNDPLPTIKYTLQHIFWAVKIMSKKMIKNRGFFTKI